MSQRFCPRTSILDHLHKNKTATRQRQASLRLSSLNERTHSSAHSEGCAGNRTNLHTPTFLLETLSQPVSCHLILTALAVGIMGHYTVYRKEVTYPSSAGYYLTEPVQTRVWDWSL